MTETACESYVWHGETYTASGTYTYAYTNADGCPSVDTLHLTVNYPAHQSFTETAYDTYTWTNGDEETYTQTGTYYHSHLDANGCTQVDTLFLTVYYTSANEFSATACEEYEWDGVIYTESGIYERHYTDIHGADSLMILHLTINHGTHNVVTETACESFTWHGQTYTASGTYTYAYTNADGCPSVDTLHLTIHNPVHTAVTVAECGSYTWANGNGQTYTETGDYTYTHEDAHGCTQVDTLHLTINQPETAEITIETSDSCYIWNGLTYCTSGDYVQTLTAATGCDSVVTLHLTTSVGIDDYDLEVSMIVYPNPTSGILNVQCTINNEEWTPDEIHLFDAYGKLVHVVETHFTSNHTIQIDMSQYAYGFYFVKAVKDGKVVAVRKAVKS